MLPFGLEKSGQTMLMQNLWLRLKKLLKTELFAGHAWPPFSPEASEHYKFNTFIRLLNNMCLVPTQVRPPTFDTSNGGSSSSDSSTWTSGFFSIRFLEEQSYIDLCTTSRSISSTYNFPVIVFQTSCSKTSLFLFTSSLANISFTFSLEINLFGL